MKNRGEINKGRWWETRSLTEETAENSRAPGVLRKDLEGGGHPRALLDTVGRQTRKAEKLAILPRSALVHSLLTVTRSPLGTW